MTKKDEGVVFQIWVGFPEYGWVYKKFKPRYVTERDGYVYKLFTTKTAAAALGRTGDCLRKWRAKGNLPEPIFAAEGDKAALFSEDQIRLMQFAHRRILGNDPRASRGPLNGLKDFFDFIAENWDVRNFDPDNYEVVEEPTGKNDVHFD